MAARVWPPPMRTRRLNRYILPPSHPDERTDEWRFPSGNEKKGTETPRRRTALPPFARDAMGKSTAVSPAPSRRRMGPSLWAASVTRSLMRGRVHYQSFIWSDRVRRPVDNNRLPDAFDATRDVLVVQRDERSARGSYQRR